MITTASRRRNHVRRNSCFQKIKFRVPVPPPTSHKAAPSLHCPPHTKQKLYPHYPKGNDVHPASPQTYPSHSSPKHRLLLWMSPYLVLPLEADPSLYPKRPEHHPKARLSHKAGSLPMKQLGTSECSQSAGPRGLCQATDPIWVQLGPASRGSTTQRTTYRPVSKARLEPPTPADLPAEAGKASVPTAAEPTLLP